MANQNGKSDGAIIPHTLDDYFKTVPIGSVDKAISENLYGINHRQTPGMVPSNKDMYGYTFFTRPQLNLQSDNILNMRFFYPLLTQNDMSIQRFVRCTLDPRLQHKLLYDVANSNVPKDIGPLNCHLVDPEQVFIPILTNNIQSLSGWPDITLPTFDSKKGLYNEVYSQANGITRNYESFDLDVSFRNTRGDPILYMFYIWLHYSSLVFEGKLVPYPDFLAENRIDYNTRIYRLVMDQNKTVVKKITATGAAFPISVPTGSFFDYSSEKPYNDQNKDITIRFRCMGSDYLDDILISEFNAAVGIFNPAMEKDKIEKDRKSKTSINSLVKVPVELLSAFNNRGYPYINRDTYELEWYVKSTTFNSRTDALQLVSGGKTKVHSISSDVDYSETGSSSNRGV
jgi:hypothetical protein